MKFCSSFCAAALTAALGFVGGTSQAITIDSNDARIDIKVEQTENSPGQFKVIYRILNLSDKPIYCSRHGRGKPNGIDSLFIEVLQPDGSWITLPEPRDLPAWASDPVVIAPGTDYDDFFVLNDPYELPAAPPSGQPHSFSLKGLLRLRLNYLLGKKEWSDYVATMKRIQGNSKLGKTPARRLVFSKTFELTSGG